jgi:hypothetical protein
MNKTQLSTLIKKIGKNAAAQRDDIQAALIGCATFAQVDRNTAPFDQLFAAVGAGTRLEGMLKWASLYAPVHFKDERVVLSDKRQKECANSMTVEAFVETLESSEKWYAIAKPEKVANPWDSVKFAEHIALYLETAAKKAEKNGDPEMAQLVKDAEMLLRVKLNTQFDAVEV